MLLCEIDAKRLAKRLHDGAARERSGCWYWMLDQMDNGYGRLVFEGVRLYAHRAAYELAHGPIPPGFWVCHHCDTPSCVNPAHLFLGTPAENVADARTKGRLRSGPQVRYSQETRDLVHMLRSDGLNWKDIAVLAGISHATAYSMGKKKATPTTGGSR